MITNQGQNCGYATGLLTTVSDAVISRRSQTLEHRGGQDDQAADDFLPDGMAARKITAMMTP